MKVVTYERGERADAFFRRAMEQFEETPTVGDVIELRVPDGMHEAASRSFFRINLRSYVLGRCENAVAGNLRLWICLHGRAVPFRVDWREEPPGFTLTVLAKETS